MISTARRLETLQGSKRGVKTIHFARLCIEAGPGRTSLIYRSLQKRCHFARIHDFVHHHATLGRYNHNQYLPKTESRYYANSVVISGSWGCHDDNLRWRQWRQSWYYGHSRFSVMQFPHAYRMYKGYVYIKWDYTCINNIYVSTAVRTTSSVNYMFSEYLANRICSNPNCVPWKHNT